MVKTEQVQYTNISAPHIASPDKPVLISDQTYAKHMNRLQSAMQKKDSMRSLSMQTKSMAITSIILLALSLGLKKRPWLCARMGSRI